MNYLEARHFMEGPGGGIHLELDRIKALLAVLGNPEKQLHCIHIAGTNGKGSILSYISTTLTCAGYKVGRYISPTLYSYLERFQINGHPIDEETYCDLTGRIYEACREIEAKGIPCPSAFELETVLCFLLFQESGCDYVVLECGMGGRDDATNVIPAPLLAVFASISLDHTGFLGETLEEIAAVKGGIIKKGCSVVSAPQKSEVVSVLQNICKEKQAAFTMPDLNNAKILKNTLEQQVFFYDGQEIAISLPGSCQLDNALTAYEALKALQQMGISLSDEQILQGLRSTIWSGRFTMIHKDPVFIVDGAHNPDAAARLRTSIDMYFKGKRLIFILGVLADKDYTKVLEMTAPLADRIFTIQTPDNVRALPAEKLAEAVKKWNPAVEACGTIEQAAEKAFACASAEDVIISFGSLSFIGEITGIVQKKTMDERA